MYASGCRDYCWPLQLGQGPKNPCLAWDSNWLKISGPVWQTLTQVGSSPSSRQDLLWQWKHCRRTAITLNVLAGLILYCYRACPGIQFCWVGLGNLQIMILGKFETPNCVLLPSVELLLRWREIKLVHVQESMTLSIVQKKLTYPVELHSSGCLKCIQLRYSDGGLRT